MTTQPALANANTVVVEADLARMRLDDYLRRRTSWARRMRALLKEEEALDALGRSLLEALAPPAEARVLGGGSDWGARGFANVVHAFERRLITHALEACGGVQRDAAAVLGISPTTLNEKLKRLGIPHGRHAAA
jgi:DNA-binding NtrC family response regulator